MGRSIWIGCTGAGVRSAGEPGIRREGTDMIEVCCAVPYIKGAPNWEGVGVIKGARLNYRL
jgi:hypothetical protein